MQTQQLTAGAITTGTLAIGGPGSPPEFEAYTATGFLFMRIDTDGMLLLDPADPMRALWLYGGELRASDGYTGDVDTTAWDTAVTPEGINASSISFGQAPGGHNEIPNSGFEMVAFAAGLSKVWTATADWATGTSQVNVDTSTGDLKMSTVTY